MYNRLFRARFFVKFVWINFKVWMLQCTRILYSFSAWKYEKKSLKSMKLKKNCRFCQYCPHAEIWPTTYCVNNKSKIFICVFIVLEIYNFVFSYLGLLNFSFNNLAPAKNRSRQRCGFVEVCIDSFIHLAKDLQRTKVQSHQWSKKQQITLFNIYLLFV